MRLTSFLLFFLLLGCGTAWADCEGQFTPVAGTGSPFSQVHFFPKNGNLITIEGKPRTIPPGIGVISGGVIGIFDDASIDKVSHQHLTPLTQYFVYVFMSDAGMTMDFSTTGHREDVVFGNEVHAQDPTRSLVGMVRTNASGRFLGDATSQLTLSWCNRVRIGLVDHLEGLETSSTQLSEASRDHRIEWLQWGINNSFTQGADVPDIQISATVNLDIVGSCVETRIGIDDQIVGNLGEFCQHSVGDVGMISSTSTGWGNEGYHFAQALFRVSLPGAYAKVISGVFYASRLSS